MMKVILPDGTTVQNVSAFWEFRGVIAKTEDLDRLKRIHDRRLGQKTARELIEHLAAEFNLPVPKIKFSARTDRGEYDIRSHVIRVRANYISSGLLAHEFAHHWLESIGIWEDTDGDKVHGGDFTSRLDRAAEATEKFLDDRLAKLREKSV